MKNKLIQIKAVQLAIGLQKMLLDMKMRDGISEPHYPISEFERLIQEEKGVSALEAKLVTDKVINTGIIRWEILGNNFVL